MRMCMCKLLCVTLLYFAHVSNTQKYEESKALFDSKVMNTSYYSAKVRPKLDQSQTLFVDVNFALISVVNVDDVSQTMTCNGFLNLLWIDERITWNPSEHGGVTTLQPAPEDIWIPRMIVINTISDRDLFKDDHAPLIFYPNGLVIWLPGALFPVSCALEMSTFPFDKHTCNIQISMNLKRRPDLMLISLVLPIVFLSFLNMLVFTIPVDSGEKISYGITVLLALSMFLGIMNSMLPSSGDQLPLMTLYLFVLLTKSAASVLVTIAIVTLYHKERKEKRHQSARIKLQNLLRKFQKIKSAVRPFILKNTLTINDTVLESKVAGEEKDRPSPTSKSTETNDEFNRTSDGLNRNKYNDWTNSINSFSLYLFLFSWFAVTICFFTVLMIKASA